jgi:hypothetical protein
VVTQRIRGDRFIEWGSRRKVVLSALVGWEVFSTPIPILKISGGNCEE